MDHKGPQGDRKGPREDRKDPVGEYVSLYAYTLYWFSLII